MGQADSVAAALENLQQSWTLTIHTAVVTSMCSWEMTLLSCGWDLKLNVTDLRPVVESGEPPMHIGSLDLPHAATSCAASRSRIFLACGSSEIEVISWSSGDAMLIGWDAPLRGHTRAVTAVAASDTLLYSSANDMSIRMWDASSGRAIATLGHNVEPCGTLSVAGDWILSTAQAGGRGISLWKHSLLQARAREWCAVPAICEQLLGGGKAGDGAPAKRSELRCVHTFVETGNAIHAAVLAGGEHAALSASQTGEVQVWDLQRLRRAASHTHAHFGHESPLVAVALIGDAICTAGRDLTIRVVRAPTKKAEPRRKRAAPLSSKRRGSLLDAEVKGEEAEAEAQARRASRDPLSSTSFSCRHIRPPPPPRHLPHDTQPVRPAHPFPPFLAHRRPSPLHAQAFQEATEAFLRRVDEANDEMAGAPSAT